MTFVSGLGPLTGGVGTTNDFIGPTATLTVTGTQRIALTASKALGSTIAGGANQLNLYTCYQSTASGSPINTIGAGLFGLSVAQNQRTVFTLPGVTPVLAAGTYQVGLCGSSVNSTNWNSNEYGYVTAFVVQ